MLVFPICLVASFLQAPLTLEMRAARVEVVLRKLSEVSGQKLETTPQLANEVLLVSVKNVSLRELMAKIAKVESAEWRDESGLLRLVPDTTARNLEASAEQSARFANVKAMIDKRVASLNPKPASKTEPVEAPAGFGSGVLPSDRAITNLLRGVGPGALAGLDGDSRLVFSTAPTRMQRPLAANAGNILRTYFTDHNAQVPDMVRAQAESEKQFQSMNLPDYVKEMMGQGTAMIKDPAKSLLIISRTMFTDMLTAQLITYDSKGTVLDRAESYLDSGVMEDLMAQPEKEVPAQRSTPIEFSEDSTKLATFMSSPLAKGTVGKVDEALEAKLLHPEIYDPLSFSVTDSLLAVARQDRKQLVAAVPDGMISMGTFIGRSTPKTVEAFRKTLLEGKEAKLLADPAWDLVVPLKPVASRRNRLDRRALANLLQAAVTRGTPSLDDLAAYSLDAPPPMQSPISQTYLMLFAPSAISGGMTSITDWNVLRVYARLSPLSRKTLADGGRVPLGSLDPVHLGRFLFGSNSRLQLATEVAKQKDSLSMMAELIMGRAGKDYRQEPTEAMPAGIPEAGYLEVAMDAEPVVSPLGSSLGTPNMLLGAEELAMLQFLREDPKMKAMGGMMPTIDKVRLGSRTNYRFTFTVAPDVMSVATLTDTKMPKDAKVISMTGLPDDLKKRIALKLVDVKKSPLATMAGFMGQTGTKPPQ